MTTKFEGILIVVENMERSKKFYKEFFDLDVICDYGSNATLTGGISLQVKDSWLQYTGKKDGDVKFQGNDMELYFVGTDVIQFNKKAKDNNIQFYQEMTEMPWGQKTVRIYDPDRHIIEVGEDMVCAAKRLLSEGMSVEAVAEKTMFPIDVVRSFVK
jgi:catechol 2,3-dioxygenase-like lactoylglutathione lyase family enzyme